MKTTIKFIMLLALSVTTLTSCFLEDVLVETEEPSATNDDGANLASFTNTSRVIGGIANGDEYVFDLKMSVYGPTVTDLNGDVAITISVDPSSTAVEGTHFKLDVTAMTLAQSNNYLGFFPLTLLSDGIDAPLAVSPVLKLIVSNASGADNVLGSGKPITLTLNYLCNSELAGDYDAEMQYTTVGGDVSFYSFIDTFVETGTGEYRTTVDHHWGSLGVGTPGYTFFDVCGVITIPGQNLADYYGNWVDDLGVRGFADPDTGVTSASLSVTIGSPSDTGFYNTGQRNYRLTNSDHFTLTSDDTNRNRFNILIFSHLIKYFIRINTFYSNIKSNFFFIYKRLFGNTFCFNSVVIS